MKKIKNLICFFFLLLLQVKFVIVYLQITFVKNQGQHDHLLLTIEYLLMNQVFVKQLNKNKISFFFLYLHLALGNN